MQTSLCFCLLFFLVSLQHGKPAWIYYLMGWNVCVSAKQRSINYQLSSYVHSLCSCCKRCHYLRDTVWWCLVWRELIKAKVDHSDSWWRAFERHLDSSICSRAGKNQAVKRKSTFEESPSRKIKPEMLVPVCTLSCNYMCMCLNSPHSAECQEAVEQCMQQIIGHIWTKSHQSAFYGSFFLLSWTSFRSAEKQKKEQDERQQWYIKHYSQTLESRGRRVGGWNLYYSDYSDFRSRYSDFISCLRESGHAIMHTHDCFCLQESARRKTQRGPRAMMSLPRFGLPHRMRWTLASIWIQIQSCSSFYVRWAKLD